MSSHVLLKGKRRYERDGFCNKKVSSCDDALGSFFIFDNRTEYVSDSVQHFGSSNQ